MRSTKAWLLAPFLLTALAGCLDSDVGVCCKVVAGADGSLIPQPETNMSGDPRDVIAQDPKFDCSQVFCVSYQGSPAYCTRQCRDASDCPDGYACQPVLQSDPPEGSQISPDDKFCVKKITECIGG